MYQYQAKIIRVVDGDTVHADVDLGFDTHVNVTLRLAGINAPEKSTREGVAAFAWLSDQISGKTVTVDTAKDRKEKFGRYLAKITLSGQNESINEMLVAQGYAVKYPS